MNHPPIPPNCDMFYESESKTGPYWIINNLAVTSICLHDTDKDDRKIIAAVARCAWSDEKRRLKSELGEMCTSNCECDNPTDIRSTLSIRHAISNAKQNAKSWRLWGEWK